MLIVCASTIIVLFASACSRKSPHATSYPQLLDDQLRLSLVAEDPEIVTPVGIAIDSLDRVYVLESHTHTPPDDYAGPVGDQVKVFKTSGNALELVGVYADGINDGMNLTFGPDGYLYVVSSQAVTRYPDRDGDGFHDGAEVVIKMTQPENVYDHAGLLGIAGTADGWLYVSRGNTGSKYWKISGADGTSVEGYGDGGNIIRCRLDGSNVEEVATGFWNPFDLAFDGTGRLFVIDNDPDSRGPNRLIDVVEGGDYGYKSLYGGSGIHPYLAWNGELPGTLPYVIGLGEAPSGMLDTRHSALPSSYSNSLLITIWEEKKIVAVSLDENEGSITGDTRDVILGESNFRPVAFAANSEGAVYVTDWVIREYPNHGKGRIWKLEANDRSDSQALYSEIEESEAIRFRERIKVASEKEEIELLERALLSGDPYSIAAARKALGNPVFRDWVYQLLDGSSPELKVQAALVLESMQVDDASAVISKLLDEADENVIEVALLWAGRRGVNDVLPQVEFMLTEGRIPSTLFDTYLATIRHLQPEFIKAMSSKEKEAARSVERNLPAGYLDKILRNGSLDAEIRALALSRSDENAVSLDLLADALDSKQSALQEAALFFLVSHRVVGGDSILVAFIEHSRDPELKADAMLALSGYTIEKDTQSAIPGVLIDEMDYWREGSVYGHGEDAQSESYWLEAIRKGGDSRKGRRVFFSRRAQCSTCHVHSGWGGVIGPDLTNIGDSKSAGQILRAILEPSAEIAPEWQGWFVKTSDGESHFGRQIDVGLEKVELMTLDGIFRTFTEVESYGVAQSSLMPEGLHLQLSKQDMSDLISFLINKP